MTNTITLLKESKSARWTALMLISFTMLAAYFFVDMLAPLQQLLEVNYKWNPQVYGTFSGSEYYLNMFGFLLVSGIILDKLGIRFSGLLSTLLMLLGGVIKLYALTDYFNSGGFGFTFFDSFMAWMPASAKLASVGYAIFGIGVEMCGITVSKTIVKWFKGKELALAMGMEMATARMGASAAFFFSSMIAGNEPSRVVIVGCALLVIGLLTFLTYVIGYDMRLDKQTKAENTGQPAEEEFKFSDFGKIVTNKAFWYISLLCVLFYSAVFPFLKYAVNMMQNKLDVSAEIGGWVSGLLPVGTILLTPIIGSFIDKKGKAASTMMLGALLLITSHLIFAIAPPSLTLYIIAIMILGVAFSLVPASLWPSVPKVVEERYLGSAYAVVFLIQNWGLGLIPAFIGIVLNAVNPGVADSLASGDISARYDYTIPMLVFASLGVFALLFGYLLKIEDKKKGYGLELPNIQK
ncbi:MAG: MFS transporter [Candidatus Kapabacteria bacterium]|nr:MFS transporter [Ignavibacteriota bacterium]MCW5885082.1 MFS transporter [Candidatus Kapabacteria bacterium]